MMMPRILPALGIVGLLLLVAIPPAIGQSQDGGQAVATPSYVGSQSCAECHEAEMALWRNSHHALAWTEPTAENMLGDFDDAELVHRGVTTRFYRQDGKFFIETDGPDGGLASYDVMGVAGIAPLQQYLVETEPGRLQAHDVAWDAVRKRWYHLYPAQSLDAGNGLHWTGPYKNWNARCAECHATGYEKRYAPRARQYSSTQAETGVGCEACHGPASAHVAWARGDAVAPDEGVGAYGLTAHFGASTPEVEIQQCAGCHARRGPLSDTSPLPGTPFHDSYRLALLRPGLYHPDGTIQDEVYVYGSFLQSKMYASGVRCSDCHDPHSAKRLAPGNGVCTQCHSPAGNPRFPTLRKTTYDDPVHHFHEQGSDGAACASCHMIERAYMGIDGRRDHSFRVPRPDLTAETGAPNACNDCHDDRSPAWAAAEVVSRFPESTRRGPHFSQVIGAGRFDPAANSEALLRIANDDKASGIVRATALEMLHQIATPELANQSAELLTSSDPLIREAAIGVQHGAGAAVLVQRILPLLEDERRSVRIAAARAFVNASVARLPRDMASALSDASADWQRSLLATADFPETQLVIGGIALTRRDLKAAEAAFQEAVRFDPQLTNAWSILVRIRDAMGNREGAVETLDRGLEANPTDFNLLSLKIAFEEQQ